MDIAAVFKSVTEFSVNQYPQHCCYCREVLLLKNSWERLALGQERDLTNKSRDPWLAVFYMVPARYMGHDDSYSPLGSVAAADSERLLTYRSKAIPNPLTFSSASPASPQAALLGAVLSLGSIQMSSCNQHAINRCTPWASRHQALCRVKGLQGTQSESRGGDGVAPRWTIPLVPRSAKVCGTLVNCPWFIG